MDSCLYTGVCMVRKKEKADKENNNWSQDPSGILLVWLLNCCQVNWFLFSSRLLGELILLFAPFHTLAPKCFPLPCSPPPLFTLFSPLQFSWVPVSHPFTLLTTIHLHTPHLPFLYTNASRSFFSHPQPPLLYAALFSQANHAEMQCTCVSVGHLALSLTSSIFQQVYSKANKEV